MTKPIPIVIEDEVIDWEMPPDLHYLLYDVEKILDGQDEIVEGKSIEEIIGAKFIQYCRDCYCIEDISFFEDYSYEDVIRKSENQGRWDECFKEYEKAKESFLTMKLVRD